MKAKSLADENPQVKGVMRLTDRVMLSEKRPVTDKEEASFYRFVTMADRYMK